MDVFSFRDRLIGDYADYTRSFIRIRDARVAAAVEEEMGEGLLWPEPLIQLNPAFEPGPTVGELVGEGVLHPGCRAVFRAEKGTPDEREVRFYRHQEEAVRAARTGRNYVLTTGTGSGKSLAYIVPIVDHVLRAGSGRGVQAIIVYPMNALANSQYGELEKFLGDPRLPGAPVTFARYTGQESDEEKQAIIARPPDVLLTNYVMLELLMTRPHEQGIIRAAQGLRFLVLDELHTYRGRQGADVALLVRRVRDRMSADALQCVGTSATMASAGTHAERQAAVAEVAGRLFGAPVRPEDVIGETLRRATADWAPGDAAFEAALRARVAGEVPPPADYAAFVADPLARWIESEFGVRWDADAGRLTRVEPKTLGGGACRAASPGRKRPHAPWQGVQQGHREQRG